VQRHKSWQSEKTIRDALRYAKELLKEAQHHSLQAKSLQPAANCPSMELNGTNDFKFLFSFSSKNKY
jgi:hypothetical protein